MRIYEDKSLKKELKKIDFGIVEASNQKELTIFLKNDSEATLEELNFNFPKLPNTELLEIVNAPRNMQPNATDSLKIRWKPSLNFKQALSLELEITGNQVFYSNK
jgi:hypothetical protein